MEVVDTNLWDTGSFYMLSKKTGYVSPDNYDQVLKAEIAKIKMLPLDRACFNCGGYPSGIFVITPKNHKLRELTYSVDVRKYFFILLCYNCKSNFNRALANSIMDKIVIWFKNYYN